MNIANFVKKLQFGEIFFRRNPLFYGNVLKALQMLDGADNTARHEFDRDRVSRILTSASRTIYGQSVENPVAIDSWPLLDKARVRASADEFRVPLQPFAVVGTSGGTTGMPMRFWRSLENICAEQATVDFLLQKVGVDARHARIAVLRADSFKLPTDQSPPFGKRTHGGSRLILSSHHLNGRTVRHFLREIEAFSPDVLWVYPSPLESLCTLARREGLKLRVPVVLSSSEVLSSSAWRLISDTLRGARLVDYYGQAERVAAAYATSEGQYRFVAGYSRVELQPVREDDGQHLYEIVGTSFWNHVMPLIRYRTGDLVALPVGVAESLVQEVASGARAFSGVMGRSAEYVYSPEGVRIVGLNHLPRGVEHVVRIQIIQETLSKIRILVLADPGFSEQDEHRLRDNALAKLSSNIEVSIEIRERLETTAQGKSPFVIVRPQVTAQFVDNA